MLSSAACPRLAALCSTRPEGLCTCACPCHALYCVSLSQRSPAAAQLSFSPSERAIVSGWAGWADSYAAFFLQCVRLWVADKERRHQEGSGLAPEPDGLPCIRLLADSAFTNQLRHVSLFILQSCSARVVAADIATAAASALLCESIQIPERSPTTHRGPCTSKSLCSIEHRRVLCKCSVEASLASLSSAQLAACLEAT